VVKENLSRRRALGSSNQALAIRLQALASASRL
jgi:hypothetical protein